MESNGRPCLADRNLALLENLIRIAEEMQGDGRLNSVQILEANNVSGQTEVLGANNERVATEKDKGDEKTVEQVAREEKESESP